MATLKRPYTPLLTYLESVDSQERCVTLSFAEIEGITGHNLPASAMLTPYWSSSPTARVNWGFIGWSARLQRLAREVTFTRVR